MEGYMPSQTKAYKCDRCGALYESYGAAEVCEKRHVTDDTTKRNSKLFRNITK